MVDKDVVEEFLTEELSDAGIDVPQDIDMSALSETFSIYVADDYYEWLKDNFRSFFNSCDPDWDWVRSRLAKNLG